jgi:hypothetical protein
LDLLIEIAMFVILDEVRTNVLVTGAFGNLCLMLKAFQEGFGNVLLKIYIQGSMPSSHCCILSNYQTIAFAVEALQKREL